MTADVSVRVLAPAKINFYLRIVGRRPDGYHLLDSLMLPVDLFDEIDISVARGGPSGIGVACDTAGVPEGRANLAHRAAETFLRHTEGTARIDIRLNKRIPAGAGLGGGSSDAASVLLALNRVLGVGRSRIELAAWGAELGADVPFFIWGRPARIEGVGEIVTPLAGWEGMAIVVAFPGRTLSTAEIYKRYDEEPSAHGRASLTNRALATSIADFAASGTPLRELLVNDLEAVAVQVYPELQSVKKLLLQLGADGVLMTGSGSAVFGLWPSREAAEGAAEVVRGRGVWAAAVETLAVSPAAL
jgi:4-diphosphocytidyl-2-C-methyl-D-erythritol kinase